MSTIAEISEWVQKLRDTKAVNWAAIEAFHRDHRWVGVTVICGKEYDWVRHLESSRLILIGPGRKP